MVAFRQSGFCRDAEPFYYDLSAGLENAWAPQHVCEHVAHCTYCQARIRRLQKDLEAAEDGPGGGQADKDQQIIDTLGLHFEHIGQCVTCSRVKPFVPTLVIPSPRIRIPTPITVHLDHCELCAADLETLRNLNLEAAQLDRLSQVFAQAPAGPSVLCRRAEAHMPRLAAGCLEGIDTRILNHVCLCPRCRDRLFACRQERLDTRELEGTDRGAVSCGNVALPDIFDYVVPYGSAAVAVPAASLPVARHVRTCPQCTERVQTLHETVYGIVERPDSETATVFTTTERADPAREAAARGYAAYGVDVKVVHRQPQPVARGRRTADRVRTTLRRGISRSTVRAALAAAAVIPIALLLFVNLSPATALTGDEVNSSYAHAPYVHRQRFSADRDGRQQLTQEDWISRPEGTLLVRKLYHRPSGLDESRTYYDLEGRQRYSIDPKGGLSDPNRMTDLEYSRVLQIMNVCLDVSGDGRALKEELRPVAPQTPDGQLGDIVQYELVRPVDGGSGRPSGIGIWRPFLNPVTRLPEKIEAYHQRSGEEPELLGTQLFTYLDDQKMVAALKRMGVPSASPAR